MWTILLIKIEISDMRDLQFKCAEVNILQKFFALEGSEMNVVCVQRTFERQITASGLGF